MSVIIPPPNLNSIFSSLDSVMKIMDIGQVPELQSLISKACDQYFYWSDVYRRMPSGLGIKPEEVWAYLKLGRRTNRKKSPINDKKGALFTYWIPDCLLRNISDIDKWSGGQIITNEPVGLPAKERYILNSLMDEAIASSQLEGASTEHRVAKEMLRSGRRPTNKNELMIFNNWKAMRYIREHIKKELTKDMLCDLQNILTEDTLGNSEESGKLRASDDIFVYYKEEIVHEPPKAETLNERLDRLCEFANKDDEDNWIHPVIKGAMIHFWLAYIHPFNDGNGRTARAVMYWYLLSRGYELFQYLSISKHFLRAPGQYVKSYLYTENDDNDLTYFLVYNLFSIRFAMHELKKYLQHKQVEMAQANQLLIRIKGLNQRQKSLIQHSIQHPDFEYTIEAHKNMNGIVYETARKDLMALSVKGFLKKMKKGKRLLVFMPTGKAMEKLHKQDVTKTLYETY